MSLLSPFISVFLILTFWGTILILSDYILPGGRDFECITSLLLRNNYPKTQHFKTTYITSHSFYGQEIWVVQAQAFSISFSQAVDQD